MKNVIPLQPRYSERDAKLRNDLILEIEKLRREFQSRAEPYMKALADIEARYPTQVLVLGQDD